MVQFLDQEGPLEKETAAHSVFLPGEFHGQRSLVGYSPLDRKELDTTERLTHTHRLVDLLPNQEHSSIG